MLTELAADIPLRTPDDVPPVALREGDRILTHPTDGNPVEWRVTALRRDDDGLDVVDYRTPDGEVDSFTVTDPGTRFTVEVRL